MQHNTHQTNAVTRIIGSPLAGLLFLGLALYAQTPHTQNAFFELGHDKMTEFALRNSWAYAIALELAVLYFVVRGHFQPSYIFAFVSVAMNVAYYTIHGNDMIDLASNWPNWLISISLPVAIAYYSHCIAGTVDISLLDWIARKWLVLRRVAIRLMGKLHRGQPAQQQQPAQMQPLAEDELERQESEHPDIAERIAQLKGEGLDRNAIIDQLLNDGYTGNAIAQAMKINASTVSRRRNKIAQPATPHTNGHSKQEAA